MHIAQLYATQCPKQGGTAAMLQTRIREALRSVLGQDTNYPDLKVFVVFAQIMHINVTLVPQFGHNSLLIFSVHINPPFDTMCSDGCYSPPSGISLLPTIKENTQIVGNYEGLNATRHHTLS
jgi:hypothetical protein